MTFKALLDTDLEYLGDCLSPFISTCTSRSGSVGKIEPLFYLVVPSLSRPMEETYPRYGQSYPHSSFEGLLQKFGATMSLIGVFGVDVYDIRTMRYL